MSRRSREVLLVGSVPLPSASAVFETVSKHLGSLVSRIPDGEQIGWSSAVMRTVAQPRGFRDQPSGPSECRRKRPDEHFQAKAWAFHTRTRSLRLRGQCRRVLFRVQAVARTRRDASWHVVPSHASGSRYFYLLYRASCGRSSSVWRDRPCSRKSRRSCGPSRQRPRYPTRYRHGGRARGVSSTAARFRPAASYRVPLVARANGRVRRIARQYHP